MTLTSVVEYLTKLLVIASMATAIFLAAWLSPGAWANLLPVTLATFLTAACLSFIFEELSAAVVLFFTYLMPALLIVVLGRFAGPNQILWVAALFGAIVPRSVRSGWAIAARWKAPLVLWALTVALCWPVVVLRELDFTPAAVYMTRLPVSGAAISVPNATSWICGVATTLGVGILWFDWLFAVYKDDEPRFRRRVLGAIGASWAIATATGIYQLFGDMLFLNRGLFGALGRASGTMYDANPFGVVVALGGPALVAAAWLTHSRPLRALSLCGLVASWVGVWASASRIALGASLIAVGFLIYTAWSGSAWRCVVFSRARIILVAVTTMVAVVALVVAAAQVPASGPLPRLRRTLPAPTVSSMAGFAREMWNRNGYGVVATHLIGQFPLFGIGVGSFHPLVRDYDFLLRGRRHLPPDNAQNWYRHQFVENGLVGSIGWIVWVVMFGWFVLAVRSPQPTRVASGVSKGILTAFAVGSLVGMPAQNVAVTITFWTLTFWFLLLADGGPQRSAHLGATTWIAIWTIVALSVAGTAYTARHRLRVPQRAVAGGWPYSYGFADGAPSVNLGRHSSAWAGRHAVAVLAPSARWVKLTVSVDRLNIAKGPVDVKVWCDNESILAARVGTPDPIIRYVRVRDGTARMMVETWVSRSVRPADHGMEDTRELGLLVEWDFVETSRLPT